MCYTRKAPVLGRESRRVTESRLMEKEVRYQQEEHIMRWSKEHKPLPEKVKEVVVAK
jgi:hypothetical protein